LKKSNQKTFASCGVGTSVPIGPNRRLGLIGTEAGRPQSKSLFGSFSSEKEHLSFISRQAILRQPARPHPA
jgi:hypothetical protein